MRRALVAVGAAVLLVALTMLVGGVSLAPVASPSASPSALSSLVAAVSPSGFGASPTPAGTRRLDPAEILPIGSPEPGDRKTARELLRTFQDALTGRHWKAAWALLEPKP